MIPPSQSVIAVPPLALDASGRASAEENRRLIRHLTAGGLRILLYGGNAVFYHLRPSEYASTLDLLASAAPPGTDIVPSAGPAYGLSMDQAAILRDYPFPTAMVLPHQGLQTPDGVATGLRRFAEAYGRPIVVYIKARDYLTPALTAALVRDGLVSWIKYAIVQPDETQDPFLSDLLQLVDPALCVSGMGEQPVIHHLRDRGMAGFTTGCGCIAPALSAAMLTACQAGDWAAADTIRATFRPLEDLRNAINPVRVLHEAVALAGIAGTGDLPPLLSSLSADERTAVAAAARDLAAQERDRA
jgi:dihydrodipicolinate synthase/N-acetylneuraminate lyase